MMERILVFTKVVNMDKLNKRNFKLDAINLFNKWKPGTIIATLLVVAVAIPIILRSIKVIPVGQVGLQEINGLTTPKSLKPGLNFVSPFSQVTLVPTRIQDLKQKIEATSQEGLKFEVEISLQYRINPQQVFTVYEKVGFNNDEILVSRYRSLVREVTALYPLEEMATEKRREVANKLKERLQENLSPLGYIVEEALIREIFLPEDVQQAFNQKIKVQQEGEQMTFTLEKARQEAQQQKIQAQGEADAQKIKAQSDAQSQIVKAKAEAESQQLLSRDLTPSLLQLRAIEATEKIGTSPNAKIYIGLGNSSEGNISPLLWSDVLKAQQNQQQDNNP